MKQFFLTLVFALIVSATMAQAPAKQDTVKFKLPELVQSDRELIAKWLDEATILISNSDAPVKQADKTRENLQALKNWFAQAQKAIPSKDKPKQ